jgi:hypothetical protein
MAEPIEKASRRNPQNNHKQARLQDYALLRQACQELNMAADDALAWKIYPERLVILFKTGKKMVWRLP